MTLTLVHDARERYCIYFNYVRRYLHHRRFHLTLALKVHSGIDVLLAKCSQNGFHSSVIGSCNTYHPFLIRMPVRALFGTCVCMFIMCDVKRDVLSCADSKAAYTIVIPFCIFSIKIRETLKWE